MVGETGNDTCYVDNAADVVREHGSQGVDVVRTTVSYVLPAGADIELLGTMGNSGTDAISLTGNANGNIVLDRRPGPRSGGAHASELIRSHRGDPHEGVREVS
jgi:serralysin